MEDDSQPCSSIHTMGATGRASYELSASFYAAAHAVAQFHRQCILEERRQMVAGSRKMLETTAEAVKAQAKGGSVAAGSVVAFLRRSQLNTLVTSAQAGSQSDTGQTAGERDMHTGCNFKSAAESLAQMLVNCRQSQKTWEAQGAQQAVESIGTALLPFEGQLMQEGLLLDFLRREIQKGEVGVESDTIGLRMADVNVAVANTQDGAVRDIGPAVCDMTLSAMSPLAASKKRTVDAMAANLDPAFEQAFKRQRQMPPTPPRCRKDGSQNLMTV